MINLVKIESYCLQPAKLLSFFLALNESNFKNLSIFWHLISLKKRFSKNVNINDGRTADRFNIEPICSHAFKSGERAGWSINTSSVSPRFSWTLSFINKLLWKSGCHEESWNFCLQTSHGYRGEYSFLNMLYVSLFKCWIFLMVWIPLKEKLLKNIQLISFSFKHY